MLSLAKKLEKHSGKKVYGYLPAETKEIVDALVNELEKDERIAALYDQWYLRKENMADLSPTHIGVIERAAKVPSLSTFVAIANALGVSSDHLLQDVIDNNYESQAQEIARLVSSQSPEMQRKLCKAVQALVEE